MTQTSKSVDTLSTQPLKGMIDFPPTVLDEYEAVNQVLHRVAHQFRYREYDLPILESWDTFAVKSATEILAEQSYHFEDRGGRKILLRPEITPALARLVAKEIKQLPQPVRWYIIGRCFRYERPQKGRFREFRQLNFDILGKKHYLYDLEILRVVKELMHAFGVTPEQYVIRFNHRGIVNSWLKRKRFSLEENKQFFAIADRKNKLAPEEFEAFITEHFSTTAKQQAIYEYFACKELAHLLPDGDDTGASEAQETQEVRKLLQVFKDLENVFKGTLVFDPQVVRGFDYYTGLVFEVFSKDGEIRRSLFGGGRYDNLIGNYLNQGQEQISGIGFGMGIDIFILFLKSIGKTLIRTTGTPGVYIAPLDETGLAYSINVGEQLLALGYQVENAPVLKLAKHFNRVTSLNASAAAGQSFAQMIFIGSDEVTNRSCTVKNLSSGEQQTISLSALATFKFT